MAYNDFRPLNANEIHIVEKFWKIHIDKEKTPLEVSYEILNGGFTVCLLTNSVNLWRGVSRRSKYDKPNRIKGEALALIRAIKFSRAVQIG